MLTSAIALTGTIAAAVFGGPFVMPEVLTATSTAVTIGGLLGVLNTHQSSRREILRKHPAGYLCELQSN
jgi:hypothetical protein